MKIAHVGRRESSVGDFLAELKEKSDLKPKTLEGYAAAFRKIVADNIGRHGRGGGAKICPFEIFCWTLD
jgi:hypothetical protein